MWQPLSRLPQLVMNMPPTTEATNQATRGDMKMSEYQICSPKNNLNFIEIGSRTSVAIY